MNVNKRHRGQGTPAPPGYLTTRQAAERLGMHPKSLLRAVRCGRIGLKPYTFSAVVDGQSGPSWEVQSYFFATEAVETEISRRGK